MGRFPGRPRSTIPYASLARRRAPRSRREYVRRGRPAAGHSPQIRAYGFGAMSPLPAPDRCRCCQGPKEGLKESLSRPLRLALEGAGPAVPNDAVVAVIFADLLQ